MVNPQYIELLVKTQQRLNAFLDRKEQKWDEMLKATEQTAFSVLNNLQDVINERRAAHSNVSDQSPANNSTSSSDIPDNKPEPDALNSLIGRLEVPHPPRIKSDYGIDYWVESWIGWDSVPHAYVRSEDGHKSYLKFPQQTTEENHKVYNAAKYYLDDALAHGWNPETEGYTDLPDGVEWVSLCDVPADTA